MRYRNLGKYGIKVSELSIGSWMTDVSNIEAQVCVRGEFSHKELV